MELIKVRIQEGLRQLAWSLLFFSILLAHPPSSGSSGLFKYHQITMGTVVEITLVGEEEEIQEKQPFGLFKRSKG